jgi:hypothetical protein
MLTDPKFIQKLKERKYRVAERNTKRKKTTRSSLVSGPEEE